MTEYPFSPHEYCSWYNFWYLATQSIAYLLIYIYFWLIMASLWFRYFRGYFFIAVICLWYLFYLVVVFHCNYGVLLYYIVCNFTWIDFGDLLIINWQQYIREEAEAALRWSSVKKMFLKFSQNSQENTYTRVSFLIKLQAWGLQLYKKLVSNTGVFLWIL